MSKKTQQEAGRKIARQLFPILGSCEVCRKKPAIERHHRDKNTHNNVRTNLMFLCRRCHMLLDGRLANWRQYHPAKQPAKPCKTCGKPYKPLRNHRCKPCDNYFRRHHVERGSQKEARS